MKKSLIVSGKIRWLLVGILVLAIAGGATYYYKSSTQANTPAATPVQTATAFRGNIVLDANGTGTLAPADEASFGFGTSGQITELDVKIGDHVEAGQVIGKMDDSEVKAAYDQAKRNLDDLTTPAAIAQAKQAVAEAEVGIYNAKAALEHLISSDVYYWEGQVATAEATLKVAQTDGGANPSTDQKKKIEDVTTALTRAQNNLKATQLKYVNEYVPATFSYTVTDAETGKTHTEVVAPSEAEVAAARATYELAIETQKEDRAYLDMLNGAALPKDVPGSSLTSLVEAQTALQTAEDNLKATQLISPISGTVTGLTASVGDYVSASSIITVADLNQPYTIDTYLDAEDWSKVQAGYDADIVFDILPEDTFSGKVTAVYPELDTSSNSSLVHATVKLNEAIDSKLPVGATAAVDVISGRAENAVLIPVEALHKTNSGQYAVFVDKDGKIRLHEIEVGLQDLTHAEVKSGLQPGDVVTTGITETQ
ncbi:MAG TPA: efflux RND transporter periplasmic adaptor subunit [Anaerolineales bacterium]